MIPVRFPNPFALDPDNLGCEHCPSPDVVEVLDGDRLCAACADAWVRGQQPDANYDGHAPDDDEIADLRRAMRGAGVERGALIEARLFERGVGL